MLMLPDESLNDMIFKITDPRDISQGWALVPGLVTKDKISLMADLIIIYFSINSAFKRDNGGNSPQIFVLLR